jgi:predicted deacetylase
MQTAPPSLSVEGFPKGGGSSPRGLPPSLVVSIHDLSTVTRATVELMLEDLEKVGVPVTSLLVIPDHHHKGRIDADPKFSEMLGRAVARGHEAVLHGYYHLRPSKEGEGMATRLITRSYTAGEGEFFDLTRAEAAGLLRKGKECLANCGVPFTGFIAPAWLLGAEAEEAVRGEGFGYTTRIGEVIDCAGGRRYQARSMVYSVRAPWRRGMSLIWNELLFHALRNAPLLRVGLHPPDWEHEAIRRHAIDCIRKAAAERQVTTYGEWVRGREKDD